MPGSYCSLSHFKPPGSTTMSKTESQQTPSQSPVKTYAGGCLCGTVRFEAELDLSELTLRYWDGRNDNWAAGLRAEPWPVRARA